MDTGRLIFQEEEDTTEHVLQCQAESTRDKFSLKTGKKQGFLKETKKQGLQSYEERGQQRKEGRKDRKTETDQRVCRLTERVDTIRKYKAETRLKRK